MYFSSPWAIEGYYRGAPNFMGSGAEQGVPNQGVGPMAGGNVFTAGQGSSQGSNTGWSPTILYLFALIIVEMFVFGILARKI